MTIKEILEKEAEKVPSGILLFREGIFLKAYESSACLFCLFIRSYQARRVYYRNIDRVVLSVGFPSHLLDELMKDPALSITESTGGYSITGDAIVFSAEVCARFREGLDAEDVVNRAQGRRDLSPCQDKPPVARGISACRCMQYEPVINELIQFNIVDSSPMDCMIFLNALKKKIHG